MYTTLLGMCSTEIATLLHNNVWTRLFTVLFVVAKKCKCALISKWFNKLWCIQKNGIVCFRYKTTKPTSVKRKIWHIWKKQVLIMHKSQRPTSALYDQRLLDSFHKDLPRVYKIKTLNKSPCKLTCIFLCSHRRAPITTPRQNPAIHRVW